MRNYQVKRGLISKELQKDVKLYAKKKGITIMSITTSIGKSLRISGTTVKQYLYGRHKATESVALALSDITGFAIELVGEKWVKTGILIEDTGGEVITSIQYCIDDEVVTETGRFASVAQVRNKLKRMAHKKGREKGYAVDYEIIAIDGKPYKKTGGK
jgi:hypothetical protein